MSTLPEDERLKRLARANDRCRAASERLNEANDELAAAEIEWRLANEAIEDMEAKP
jgi:hypothetical protein